MFAAVRRASSRVSSYRFGHSCNTRVRQIVACIEQVFDLHTVVDLFLDLVVISFVRKERIVGFFVGRRCALRHIHRNPAGHLDSQLAD